MNRRADTITGRIPAHWHVTCADTPRRKRGANVLTFQRRGDRPWWDEFDALTADGFRPRRDPLHASAAAKMRCETCGERMAFRGFELPDVAFRAYAVCACSPLSWVEF